MSGKLRLSGSSSGYIELAAEATANNATITIPNAGFPGGVFASYAILEDQKANGGEGQDFSVNTWVTRDLNREYCDPDSIVSLADDQFTLELVLILLNGLLPSGELILLKVDYTM